MQRNCDVVALGAVMRSARILTTTTAIILAVSCSDPLYPTHDAGPDEAGIVTIDAGHPGPDAGATDVGTEDAGTQARPACLPLENPPIPWDCEDDVDWCDQVGDAASASSDVLATWSFLDGDDIVYQWRYLAMPFWDFIGQNVTLVAVNSGLSGSNDPVNVIESLNPMSNLIGNLGIGISERSLNGEGPMVYPPSQLDTEVTDGALFPFDSCRWGLHPTLPIVELRLPLNVVLPSEGLPTYVVMSRPYYSGFHDG
jgi:hypothetical protein